MARSTGLARHRPEVAKAFRRKPGPLLGAGLFRVIVHAQKVSEDIFMIRFLTWLRDLLLSVLNGLAKAAMLVLLLFVLVVIVSLARGDGMPGNMVLGLDLREA